MDTPFIFSGTAPALVTPFTADNAFDEQGYRKLIDWQIESGVEGLVVLGTTGENATIWPEERRKIVEVAIEQAAGRVPVIVGSGNNSTSESIVFSKEATAAGASGLLIVGPYYNKPTQAGFRAHVAAIAEATDTPIIIYNVPGRTGLNIKAETTLRIAEEVPSVRGVKEASGDIAQISDILAGRPDHLAVYSGDDEMTVPLITLGAHGVISVIANALPERFSQMVRTALAGDLATAKVQHFEMLTAMRACFYETNPIPIKTVLGAMGRIRPDMRLPLVPMEEANRTRAIKAFAALTEVDA